MFKGIVRYGLGRDRSLESEYEPNYFPTHNQHKNSRNNNLTRKEKMLGIFIGSALVFGVLITLKHIDKGFDETFNEAAGAFDNIYD